MVGRGEVTDAAWAVLEPLLPANGGRGQQWRDLPERYGPWRTAYARFRRWPADGTWDRLLAHVQTKSDAVSEVVWEVSIDSTTVRAHQHAAGARKKGAIRVRPARRSGAVGAG